jgi:hypothetical protein
VTDSESGQIIPQPCVRAFQQGVEVSSVCGEVDGTYDLPLPDGDYDLRFGASGYLDDVRFGVVVAGGAVTTVDANLTQGGTLTGILRDADTNAPLGHTCVQAQPAHSEWSYPRNDCTDGSGRYTITGLRTGSYAVHVDSVEHIDAWSSGRPNFASADLVQVVQGQTTTHDEVLTLGGAIAGSVASTSPTVDVCVEAYRADTLQYVEGTCFETGQSYRLPGLAAGSYLVWFRPQSTELRSEWWGDATVASAAATVTVVGSATVADVDATLEGAGGISGTLTLSDGGQPLVWSCAVGVYTADGSFVGSGCTDGDGSYVVGGLGAGNYRVKFSPNFGDDFAEEWFDDQPDLVSATDVSVTVGQTTAHVDASLAPGLPGAVSGHVTDAATGNPLTIGFCIMLYGSVDGFSTGHCFEGTNGAWRIANLPPDSYHVTVFSFADHTFIERTLPDLVAVGSSEVSGVAVPLERGATISGRLTQRESGGPIEGTICVVAAFTGATPYTPLVTACRYAVNGRYRSSGLPPGQYRFELIAAGGRYSREYYSADAPDPAVGVTGTVLDLGSLEQKTGIDEDLEIGGNLSGTITLPPGVSSDVTVCASVYQSATQTYVSGSCFPGAGPWSLYDPVPAGDYRVLFSGHDAGNDRPFVDQWYDDKPTFAAADTVSVTAGTTVTGVDASLRFAPIGAAVVSDFDGDGDSDRGLYRGGQWLVDGQGSTYFGLSSWASVPADFTGDGAADRAVWDAATGGWHVDDGSATTYFGLSSDVPVPGDYDGDGGADVAVWRPDTGGWFVQGQGAPTYFGLSSDVPVPGDYDGDGVTDLAVFRPATGAWFVQGQGAPTYFGLSTDVPVPGDYDGDGVTDLAVFRPATGAWFVQGQGAPTYYGLSTDLPVQGDYDGDGDVEISVFRPGSGAWLSPGVDPVYFGADGDRPLSMPWSVWKGYYAS